MRRLLSRLAIGLCVVAMAWLVPSLSARDVSPPLYDGPPLMGAPIDTNELIVFLRPGTDAAAFARGRGLRLVQGLRSNPHAFIVAADSVSRARADLPAVAADARVAAVYPNQRTAYVRMAFVPDDAYFNRNTPSPGWPGQWHLVNQHVAGRDAGVLGAWNRNITGLGVIIGIVDDCLQTTHPDLQPNYVAASSWDFGQNDPNPDPVWSDDQHGISVAGVAAARGGNGIGVTGAAPYAGLAGLRIDFPNQTTQMFVDATLYHSSGSNTNITIKNHSYGYAIPYIAATAGVNALATSVAAGTVHSFAAGNERQWHGYYIDVNGDGSFTPNVDWAVDADVNKKGYPKNPDAITVAAFGSNGTFASYSSWGAAVFVTAPSSTSGGFGITTTDRTGALGYNPGWGDSFPDQNYTSIFGGTSSAAPLVAGVLGLAKEVQPALDVRFAKHLLAHTSTIVHPTDSTVTSDGGWKTNAAGFAFNQNYGFGLINADALTEMAVQYSGVTPLVTESTGTTTVNAAIPDYNPSNPSITRTFTLSGTEPLEEVLVTLDITHTWRGDIEAFLTSPSGYTSRLMYRNEADSFNNINWTFTTNAFWGEIPAGTWSLTLRDVYSGDSGTWNSYAVTARMGELIPVPDDPPVLLTAESVRNHGVAGDLAIDIPLAGGAVEPRTGGPTQLVATFDQDVYGSGGPILDDVWLSDGSVQNVTIIGNAVTVDISDVPNATVLAVAFPGIVNDSGQANTDALCIRVLAGDVDGDGLVAVTDMVTVRNMLNQPVTAANCHIDVTVDGSVSMTDMLTVRNALNATVGTCP